MESPCRQYGTLSGSLSLAITWSSHDRRKSLAGRLMISCSQPIPTVIYIREVDSLLKIFLARNSRLCYSNHVCGRHCFRRSGFISLSKLRVNGSRSFTPRRLSQERFLLQACLGNAPLNSTLPTVGWGHGSNVFKEKFHAALVHGMVD
jgi:hypothetical protein